MRILHVSTNLEWGGGENQILALIRWSKKAGVEALLAAPPQGALYREAAVLGEGRFALPAPRTGPVVALLRQLRPDLVHVHDSAGARAGGKAGRKLGIPVVLSRRVASPLRQNLFSQRKYRDLNFAAVLAVSETVGRVFLSSSRYPTERVQVVPDGIDVDALAALEADPALREGLGEGYLAGGIGKLALKKNWPLLLETAAELKGRGLPVRWVIAGDGPDRGKLEARIAEQGLEDTVRLLGFRSDALRILKSLDLLFSPSLVEGASVTVREAMVIGTPVVIVDTPGTMESLDGHGWVVPAGDARRAANAVSEALTEIEKRQAVIAGARISALSRFSLDITLDKTLEAYRGVLGIAR
jgi:glycosyltransferase involved in cell wall biosynthesis